MKTETGYRFSLQFSSETEEQVRVGEFLEKMGNRKSTIVVEALIQYLSENPNLEDSDIHIKVQSHHLLEKKEIEALIRTIIDEKLSTSVLKEPCNENMMSNTKLALEEDISSMLGNLSLFG